MTQVSYVDVVPELESQYFLGIRSADRFIYSRVAKKITLQSRKRKKGVSARSLLPTIAALWNGFSSAEKAAWVAAAAESNLTGYKLFVQDQAARILNDLGGVATPSLLHQSWVGQLHIEAPATELKIWQTHPHFYWVSKAVPKHKGMREPILVTEDLVLPVEISLNYKSNLVSQGAGSFAKFYARFWYSYQGVDKYEELIINLDLVTDWKNALATLASLTSYVIRYDLYLHLFNVRGDLYIDNLSSFHSAQNWVRDPNCLDINQGFTLAFYQIPKHWAALVAPSGSWYESIYQDF
jgi:hypothetical protein